MALAPMRTKGTWGTILVTQSGYRAKYTYKKQTVYRRFQDKLSAQSWLAQEHALVEAARQGIQTWTHPTEREQAQAERGARSITVGDWLDQWGEKFIKETTTGVPTSAGTQRTRHVYLAHLHRAPFIDKPLRMLTAADVERWIADFDAGPIPRKKCFQTLKKALADDAAQGYIDKSPIENRPAPALPPSRQAEIPPLTPAELATIAAHMPAGYEVTVWLAACCGLRINEVCALQADDFDLSHQLLHVRHSLDAATRELKAPKTTASEATLPIPVELVPMLQELVTAHPTGPVFPAPHGGFLRHQSLRLWFKQGQTIRGQARRAFSYVPRDFHHSAHPRRRDCRGDHGARPPFRCRNFCGTIPKGVAGP